MTLTDFVVSRSEDLMFAQVAGSQAYNLALKDSDHDFMGVFVEPTKTVLGIKPYPKHIEGQKPDYKLYEVGKFAHLLLKGNPNVVEMLFNTERFNYITPRWEREWNKLVRHRKLFLNQQTLQQYLGYANGQYKRLINDQSLHTAGGKYNTKWAYHIVRLIMDATDIASGLEPQIYKEGDKKDLLMAIRNNKLTKAEIEDWMQCHINNIDGSNLPKQIPYDFVHYWLVYVRESNWQTTKSGYLCYV